MKIQRVTDAGSGELQPFRTLRRSQEQYAKGLFIAEGEKVVTRLFASGLEVRSLLLTDDWLDRKRDQIAALSPVPQVYAGPKEILEGIVGYNLHQGIMALAVMPPEPGLADVVRSSPSPRLFLAIDDLLNAENVGIIVRNARAFGVQCILVGETSSSPYLRRAVRNSLGSVFSIPVVHTAALRSALRELSDSYGMTVAAAETRADGTSIDELDLTQDVCIVVGGEDRGIRKEVLDVCRSVVEVPMVEEMDSINVANATAVCLYEVRRQRRG